MRIFDPDFVKETSLTALIPAGKLTKPERFIFPVPLIVVSLVITTPPDTVEDVEEEFVKVEFWSNRIGLEILTPLTSKVPPDVTRIALLSAIALFNPFIYSINAAVALNVRYISLSSIFT